MLIIAAAIISSLFRALTPFATQYKSSVEAHLSTLLGEPVTIHGMETGWYWFYPVVKLQDISVFDGTEKVLQLKKMLLGINLFSSLWHWQVQPGVLYIDDLDLTLRQLKDSWQIDGLKVKNKPDIALDANYLRSATGWILGQDKIIIKNISLKLLLKNGMIIPVKDINLTVQKRSGITHVNGMASLAQENPSFFQILAEMQLDPYAVDSSQGHLFFSIKDLRLSQWQGLLPDLPKEVKGHGDAQWWFDWKNGKADKIQSRMHFQDISWQDPQSQVRQKIQTLSANLAWFSLKNGWKLMVDHLVLRLNGLQWPENSLSINYRASDKIYEGYVRHVDLSSLLSSYNGWPDSLMKLIRATPAGMLNDTQLNIQDGKLLYLLSRFTQLSWQAQNGWVGVENLSGVLDWQPEEGQLELDSENVVIKSTAHPPMTLTVLNGSFDWKKFSHGLKISMERLLLQNRESLFTAQGAIDEVTEDSVGQMDLTAQLSADQAQQWWAYLPSGALKPKLEHWLRNDVKKVDNLVAEIQVHGQTKDFPFDNSPGEFTIKSHWRGVDLIFAPEWPITKDIDAYLIFDKRNLTANISHANLGEMIVDQTNLRVDDLGLDKETLLVRSRIDTDADLALSYLLASPLEKKLPLLKRLKMSGPARADLQMEFPLYPENTQTLALGDVTFNDNQLTLLSSVDNVPLNNLNGILHFDQQGVKNSQLNASILNNPITIDIQSVQQPQPATLIKILGKLSVDVLQNQLKLPLQPIMDGNLSIEALLNLTADTKDNDHLQLRSNLQGVAIHLPPPFGKKSDTSTPLTINVDIYPKGIGINLNYDQRLSSNLWLNSQATPLQLEKGIITIGSVPAPAAREKGLQLRGVVSDFDDQQWAEVLTKLPSGKTSLLDKLNSIDLKVKNGRFLQQKLHDLSLKASRGQNNWSVNLDQQSLKASLDYNPITHHITGSIARLYLRNPPKKKRPQSALSHLKVQDLPSVDLKIQDLQYNALQLGRADIKTLTTGNAWKVENIFLRTPYYQFHLKGQWQQDDRHNFTSVRSFLKLSDLSNTLKLWNVSPVVEANQGDIQFAGEWTGGFQDFSLQRVQGNLDIVLKDGRITHLSKETEEKLGIGKLLSILSLQTIPRRLKLDFSDLSHGGFSFDIFKGTFKVAKGLMSTQDSYIDGPIAYARMTGNLDIYRQLYNMDLKVSPHVTASLPLVATLAGGPIAGIATWVAGKIINQGMQSVSSYSYRISGPWRQPIVQQVSITRIKKQ